MKDAFAAAAFATRGHKSGLSHVICCVALRCVLSQKVGGAALAAIGIDAATSPTATAREAVQCILMFGVFMLSLCRSRGPRR